MIIIHQAAKKVETQKAQKATFILCVLATEIIFRNCVWIDGGKMEGKCDALRNLFHLDVLM